MIKLRIPVQAPLVTGAVNEYPIILSTPMVRAILAGVKRQTRHIVRADNSVVGNTPYRMLDFSAAIASKGAGGVGLLTVPLLEDDGTTHRIVPRWASGDRLWVKEHWRVAKPHDHELGTALRSGPDGERPVVLYEASNVGGVVARGQSGHLNCHAQPLPVWAGRLRRAMSMPQWASRITLEVMHVRVERLNDISESDAIAEGMQSWQDGYWHGLSHARMGQVHLRATAKEAYADLWGLINGARSWALNPWVWALEIMPLR